jgi:NADH:ubiquinone oxidoreductase subunit H
MYNTVIFGALYFMVRDLFLIFLIRMIIKLAIPRLRIQQSLKLSHNYIITMT